MAHLFVKDSVLAQKDLKGLSSKSFSQQIALHPSSLLLKVDGAEEPVLVHSPFQTSYRDKDGTLERDIGSDMAYLSSLLG